jgi:acyl-CoA synthetase (NDP forming)
LKQAGVVVADTMMDHTELIKTFALLNNFIVNGNRVAVIANAGYEKTYAADHLGELQVAVFSAETETALRNIMPSYVSIDPLLDLTPMADDLLYEQCLEIVLQSSSVDAVLVSITPQSMEIHTTDSEIAGHRNHVAARIVRLVKQYRKPVVVSTCVTAGSDANYNAFSQALDAGGVPAYLSASRAMACLNAFVRYRLIRSKGLLSEWLKS